MAEQARTAMKDIGGGSLLPLLRDPVTGIITDQAGNTVPVTADVLWALIMDKPAWLGVFDGTYASLSGAPTRTFTNPPRALNSAFQIDPTRDAIVSYSVEIVAQTSNSLGPQTGRVFLEYADNVGMTTNLVTVDQGVNGVASGSGILNITITGEGSVKGIIPAGKFVRIRTQTAVGSPSFSYLAGQEVLL